MTLTSELSAELKKRYNPDGSKLREAQLRMLDLLLWVDKVCKKNNIPYFLEGGTLLGAIRHKGFIPWDDDIDLGIPYQYYSKMRDVFLLEKHPQFVFQCEENDPYSFKFWYVVRDTKSKYIHARPKMIKRESIMKYTGLQIDLFPYDNHVISPINSLFSHYNWGQLIIDYLGLSKPICKFAYFLFRLQMMSKSLLHVLSPKQKFWTYGYGTCFKWRYKEDTLFPTSQVEFEGHWFPAPHNPDEYLKIHYGDYMQLPPLSELNHHMIEKIQIWYD